MKPNKIISLFSVLLLCQPLNTFALNKNETVYTNLNTDGSIIKSSVTNHLYVGDLKTLEDETELTEILNINGKETFTIHDNKLLWQTDGRDIFYRGIIEKNQPISINATYYLNGEEKKINEILGKNGTIKIILEFENHFVNYINIRGKKETLYTPFVVTAATIFDNETVSNITVSNGKVLDSGSRSIVASLAAPGLYESLGIEELGSLGSMTLEFDTKKFELPNIYLVATPKLLADTDLEVFQKLNNVAYNIQILQDNMNKIENGMKELENGSNSLLIGTTELSNQFQNVEIAVEQLKSGSVTLKNGLTSVVAALSDTSIMISGEETFAKLKTLKSSNQATINYLLTKTGMTYLELQTFYMENELHNLIDPDSPYMSFKETYELICLLNSNNSAIDTVLNTFQNLSEIVEHTLTSLKENLIKLEAGASDLSHGLTELQIGIQKLSTGSNELKDGVTNLTVGAKELNTGISMFNREGIHTINQYASKVTTYSNKLEALVTLSKEYRGFGSVNATNTTFIYQMKAAK